MTDLFFRIAERALGLAPIIQPMIAPLFAPTSYADGEEMLDILATEEQDGQSSDTSIAALMILESNAHLQHDIQPIAPTIASKEAFVANRANIPPIPPVERRATAYPELQSAQTRAFTSEQAVSAQPQYDTLVKNTQVAPAMDDSILHELPVIKRPEDNQVERRQTLTCVQPLPVMPPSIPFTGQKAPPRSTEAVKNTKHGLFHDAGRSRDGLSRGRLVEQYTGETLQESVQTTQAAPAVHVTIGRIEVRANPVPALEALPQRQHAVPKAMSLDEYLKQSEKGGH